MTLEYPTDSFPALTAVAAKLPPKEVQRSLSDAEPATTWQKAQGRA